VFFLCFFFFFSFFFLCCVVCGFVLFFFFLGCVFFFFGFFLGVFGLCGGGPSSLSRESCARAHFRLLRRNGSHAGSDVGFL